MQRQDWAAAHTDAIALARLHGTPSAGLERFIARPSQDAVAAFLRTSEERTRTGAVRGVISGTRIALLNVLNGHDEEAVAWLEQSARNRDAELVFALRDPALDALRAFARLRAIERQVRAQY